MTEIVKHEGKEYEIGKAYEFSDDEIDWEVGVLSGVDLSSFPFDFNCDTKSSSYCREVQPESLGKITKVKINPEAGKFYKISNGVTADYVMWGNSTTLIPGWGVECEMVEKHD